MGRSAQLPGAQHAAGLHEKGRLRLFLSLELRCPGIAGIVRIVKEGYPDKTAFDPKHHHYDAGCEPDAPRWFVVDVKLVRKFKRIVTLDELRRHAAKSSRDFVLLRRGNRLSVTPVAKRTGIRAHS